VTSKAPRVVVLSRPSEYEELVRRHATRAQLAFFLERRGQSLAELDQRHEALAGALTAVQAAIPGPWRRARLSRPDLPRFLFEPDDLVVAVGPDGLVANAGKYLSGQWLIGVNPEPARNEGVLVRHRLRDVAELLHEAERRRARVEERTLVEVALDDGQRLCALNEVFLGHRTHQSARYALTLGALSVRHSSSGVIVSTGTGATGWARSIAGERASGPALPAPTERALAFFAREVFPSRHSSTELACGRVAAGEQLELVSEMEEGGVVFGDGLEDDRLQLGWGVRASVRVAEQRLRLVV
jgi:NAD kinase